jgi:hypothetical protein
MIAPGVLTRCGNRIIMALVMVSSKETVMERTDSHTIRVLKLESRTGFDWWATFKKDNGRVVDVAFMPSFKGICMAAGFVGTGGRHIS